MLDVLLTVLALVALVVLGLVLAGVVRIVLLRRRHRARVQSFAPVLAEQSALFAVASDGRTQVRGVGTLVLGAEQLAFVPLVGGRDVVVERSSITSSSVSRTFMGRSSGSDLLVVTWDVDGMGDAAAFQVRDPATWRTHLA